MRAGARVHVVDVEDATFEADLAAAGAVLDAGPPFDLVFLGVRQPSGLRALAGLRAKIRPAGAIWVVRARGNSRGVGETDIIEAAKRHGLVDNKVASFSDTLTAMRLVVPVAAR